MISGKKSLLEWVLLGTGIIATIFVTLLISRIIREQKLMNSVFIRCSCF